MIELDVEDTALLRLTVTTDGLYALPIETSGSIYLIYFITDYEKMYRTTFGRKWPKKKKEHLCKVSF